MSCRNYRTLIMTTRASDRSPAQDQWLQAHLAGCEDCARLAEKVAAMERLLATLPRAAAPDGFTAAVMARAQGASQSRRAAWFDRLFGWLRPPAPVVTLRQGLALAGVLLMFASAGLLVTRRHLTTANQSQLVTAALTKEPAQVLLLDTQVVDELVERHQIALSAQPLSEPDGMRLVSY